MKFYAMLCLLTVGIVAQTYCPDSTVFDPEDMDVVITTPSGSVPSK